MEANEPANQQPKPQRGPRRSKTAIRVDRLMMRTLDLLEKRLEKEGESDLKELADVARTLFDLSQTADWTRRLANAIERNPSNLQHAPGQSPLLKQLASSAARTKKAATLDGRTGVAKLPQLPTD